MVYCEPERYAGPTPRAWNNLNRQQYGETQVGEYRDDTFLAGSFIPSNSGAFNIIQAPTGQVAIALRDYDAKNATSFAIWKKIQIHE